MTYADSLLSDDERVMRRARQHPFVLLHALFQFVLAAITAGIVIVLGGTLAQAIPNQNDLIFLATAALTTLVLVIGFIRMTLRWLTWRSEEYLVTNRRILKVEGLINKRSADSSLEKINDAVLTQSLFGRIFNYGSLDVMTAAESAVDKFRLLRDPVDFKKAMLDAKHAYFAAGGPSS